MSNELNNFWPNIGVENIVTPVTLLRIAASQLGEKTQQLITADIVTTISLRKFDHEFAIVVPSLDHYRYSPFRIRHAIDSFYPIEAFLSGGTAQLSTEADFRAWLVRVLAGPDTTKLINTILTQIQS